MNQAIHELFQVSIRKIILHRFIHLLEVLYRTDYKVKEPCAKWTFFYVKWRDK